MSCSITMSQKELHRLESVQKIRRLIERWRQAGACVDVIAEKLGRHRSTIFREIARNKFEDREMSELTGYFYMAANSRAKERRGRYRKLVRHPKLRASIIERIKHGWSPEQTAVDWLMNAAASVSATRRSIASPIRLTARISSCGAICRRAAPDAGQGTSGGVMAAASARN